MGKEIKQYSTSLDETKNDYINFIKKAKNTLANYKNIFPQELQSIVSDLNKTGKSLGILAGDYKTRNELYDTANTIEDTINGITGKIDRWLSETKSKRLSGNESDMRKAFEAISNGIKEFIPQINDISQSYKYSKRIYDDYAGGEEEEKITEIVNTVGYEGIKPTIQECLTMNAADTDTVKLFGTMIWLKANSIRLGNLCNEEKNRNENMFRNSSQQNIYIDTYDRLTGQIENCSAKKKAELSACIARYEAGMSDRFQTKLDNVNNDKSELLPAKDTYEKIVFGELFATDEYFSLNCAHQFMGDVSFCINSWRELIQLEDDYHKSLAEMSSAKKNGEYEKVAQINSNRPKAFSNRASYEAQELGTVGLDGKLDKLGIRDDCFEIRADKDRKNIISSGFSTAGVRNNVINGLKKTAEKLFKDKREASVSFESMRNSISDLMDFCPKNNDEYAEYYNKLKAAYKNTDDYLKTHSTHRFSQRGRERVEMATQLKNSLTTLAKDFTKKMRDIRLNESTDALKNGLTALMQPDTNKHPANPDSFIRSAFAEMMYQHIIKDVPNNDVFSPEKDEKEVSKLRDSMAYKAALATVSDRDLLKIANEPNEAALNEIKSNLNKYAFLDKAPKADAEAYITVNVGKANNETDKSLMFENGDEVTAEIKKHNDPGIDNRLFANTMVVATLMSGENGKDFEEISNPHAIHSEKAKAGNIVYNDIKTKLNTDEFYENVAVKFIEGLNKLSNFVENKLSAMGDITIEKMSKLENKSIFKALGYMQDMAQFIEKKKYDNAVKKLGLEDERLAAMNKQNVLAGALNPILNVMTRTTSYFAGKEAEMDVFNFKSVLGGYAACNELNSLMKNGDGSLVEKLNTVPQGSSMDNVSRIKEISAEIEMADILINGNTNPDFKGIEYLGDKNTMKNLVSDIVKKGNASGLDMTVDNNNNLSVTGFTALVAQAKNKAKQQTAEKPKKTEIRQPDVPNKGGYAIGG